MGFKLVKTTIFLSIAFLMLFVSGCISHKYFNYYYNFSDSPIRNMVLNFRKDSTFLIRNAIHGSSAFSFVGTWRKIDSKSVVLINPYIKADTQITVISPPAGERLNELLGEADHRYLFPVITRDTIIFAENMRGFTLKGYHFIRQEKSKEY